MKISYYSLLIIISTLCISCIHQKEMLSANNTTPGIQETAPQDSDLRVVWEPKPRRIAEGNDGQLSIRASESMSILYAAWSEDGKQDLQFSKSSNIGDRFSKPIRVNSKVGEVRAHGESGPKLRQGKRGIFSAWVGNRDIKFARSMNFGKSFSPDIRVNDDTGKASQSFFIMEVAPDGTPYIAWLDGRDKKTNTPGTSSLYIARSTDNGASFEKNIRISGEICPCCRPSLTFGDKGEVFVSWRHVYEGNMRTIVVASSLDGGETWSPPVPVTEKGWKLNGCAHSGSAMKYVDGKLIVVWYTGANGKANLKMARSSDNGKSFEMVQDIQGRVGDANHPNMAIHGKEAWVIFQGRDPDLEGGWGLDKPWLVRISEDGKPSNPEPLPSSIGGVAYPYLYIGNGGRVYATWTENGDDGLHVVLCRGRLSS